MLAKRIIPCLDVTAGRVVKGINFVELRDAGDPVEIAARYNEQGADELTFLDITATSDGRDLILHIIEAVASQVFIPLTVGGGVRTVADVRRLLNAGADKVSFNSAAVAEPQLIADAAAKYGAQCIVVAIDAKRRSGEVAGWDVYTHGGRVVKGINFTELRDAGDPVELARTYDAEGADELTFLDISASHEGRATTMEVVSRCAEEVFIPLTVGGGVASVEDVDRLLRAGADKVAVNTAAIHRPELVAVMSRKTSSSAPCAS